MVKTKKKKSRRGGYHDIASFRSEIGYDSKDMTDDQINGILAVDMAEKAKILEKENAALKNRPQPVSNQTTFNSPKSNLFDTMPSSLYFDRTPKISFVDLYRPSLSTDYYEKERIKREVKQEIEKELEDAQKRKKEEKKQLRNAVKSVLPKKNRSKSKKKKTVKKKK
jgi:hypothetical protein